MEKRVANRIVAIAELLQSALVHRPERSGSIQVSCQTICLLESQAFNKDGPPSHEEVKKYSKRNVTTVRRGERIIKSKNEKQRIRIVAQNRNPVKQ